MALVVTNSALGTFQTCPRLYRHKYVDLLEPRLKSEALTLGTLVHVGLEQLWLRKPIEEAIAAMRAHDGPVDQFVAARAEAMVLGYSARWASDEYETVAVEQEFAVPIKSRDGVVLSGKIDAVAKDSRGRMWLVEHKTSSEDLSAGGAYWQALHLNLQVSIYLLVAERVLYKRPFEGVIYDVIKKPSIRPLKASKDIKLKKDGTPRAGQRSEDETPAEFRDRLVDAICDNPGAYYRRQHVVRMNSELEAAVRDVLDTIDMVKYASDSDRWPRAPGACRKYGKLCDFYKVCSGQVDPNTSALFVRKERAHSELGGDSVSS